MNNTSLIKPVKVRLAFVSLFMQKLFLVTIIILTVIYMATGCMEQKVAEDGYFHKDLSEQMDALAVTQYAVGDYLRKNDFESAKWAYVKLDSVFEVMKIHVNEHPNLNEPFHYYYKQKLRTPMVRLKNGLDKKDTAASFSAYRLLVARCNSCHNDSGVEERAHE